MNQASLQEVVCFKGKEEICGFIREDVNQLGYLVEHENLPAWKRNGKGPWRALNVDLYDWMIYQRKKYLKETPGNLAAEKRGPLSDS